MSNYNQDNSGFLTNSNTAADQQPDANGNRQANPGVQVRSYGMGKGAARAAAPNPQATQGGHGGQPFIQGGSNGQQGVQDFYGNNGQQNAQNSYDKQQAATPSQPIKKKKPVSFWVAIVIAIIAIIMAAVIAFAMFSQGTSKRQGIEGQLEGKTAEEIQAELDRTVEEGMFNISIASVVQFPDGASEGELRIENVPGNRYLMSVQITRDDTGEQIYQTDMIEPNHHIQWDKLAVDLPAGQYPCTATFFAYDPETEELFGQAAAKIEIDVQS